MSFLKKLAGETALYGIPSILGRVLNFLILAPYLTRALDTDEYGVHAVLYAFAAFMMVFMTYRMETTFFRYGSEKGQLHKTFTTAATALSISSIVIFGLIILLAEPISSLLLKSTKHAIYIKWFAFILLFDTLVALPFAKLRLENKAKKFAVLKTLNVVANALFILFFLEFLPNLGGTFTTIFQGYIDLDFVFLSNLLASALIFVYFAPSLLKLKYRFDKTLFKKMMRYAWPLVIVGVAAVINQLSDRYLLMSLLPGTVDERLSTIGIYSANVRLAIFMTLFTQAFNYAAEPFFFKHADQEDTTKIYAQVGYAFTVVGCFVFLAVTLFIDQVVLIIGGDYRSGVEVVPILLLAYLWLGLYYNFSIWYKLKDRTIIGAYISVAGACLTIGINLLLIPIIGFVGAAWAAFATYGFMAIASYYTGRKNYPIPYPIFKMAILILGAIGIYAVDYLIGPNANLAVSLLIKCILIGIFAGCFYLSERKLIAQLFAKN